MTGEPKDPFKGIVDSNWGDTVDDSYDTDVMPPRFVVEGDWKGIYRNRELVQLIMRHCGPLELDEPFNVDDYTGNNDPQELGN